MLRSTTLTPSDSATRTCATACRRHPRPSFRSLLDLLARPRWAWGLLTAKRRVFGNIIGHAFGAEGMGSIAEWSNRKLDPTFTWTTSSGSADFGTAGSSSRESWMRTTHPAIPGRSSITQSLYAGLQLILPGEIAPSRCHVQSALRFMIDGQGRLHHRGR